MRSGHVEAAELLIKRGADVNKEAVLGLPLTVAVLKNSAGVLCRELRSLHVKRAQDVSTNGPNLWNVVGRDKASTKFDRYSQTLMPSSAGLPVPVDGRLAPALLLACPKSGAATEGLADDPV